jgi:hypothetical protein
VLDRLGSRGQRSVEHPLVLDLAGDLVSLLDDAVDRGTIDALGFNAVDQQRAVGEASGGANGIRSRSVSSPASTARAATLRA